ncbi:MAG TPA: carbohydrate ABC transporter permease [Candidatus Merdenecus merdavium]|nr:carbohydrate ABC transporter permease [Candidatus Merdenecus merdavium]
MKMKHKKGKILGTVFVWLIALLCIMPFIWMISASFKREADVFAIPFQLIPEYINLNNFKEVWFGKYNYPLMFLNSIKVTLLSVVFAIITSLLAGYGFSKLKFPGRNKIFLLYLATMMVPPQLLMVPKFLMFKEMGIYNTHWALILPAAFSIYGVFMIRQYMLQIPEELSEAARIDGAGDLRICFQIISPLCKPAIVTLIILFFTWSWNDYDNALIFINSKDLYTINLGLVNFMDETGMKYALIMAASVITIIPIFIIFLVAQKYFVGGLTAGSVKG